MDKKLHIWKHSWLASYKSSEDGVVLVPLMLVVI